MLSLNRDVHNRQEANEFFNWFVIFACLLFALNNWWLKYQFHNWFTGKLSDFLFCFIFPLYCSAMLSIFTRWTLKNRILLGAVVTVVSLVVMKTVPSISFWADTQFSIFTQLAIARDSVNVNDASDLIALPVVLLAVLFASKKGFFHV